MLSDKEIVAVHRLVYRLYEKYPSYVVFSLSYSTNSNSDTTLPPTKHTKLNIYTPLINHNEFTEVAKFNAFVEKLLADGVPNVRIKLLSDRIKLWQKNIANDQDAITVSKEELARLKKRI